MYGDFPGQADWKVLVVNVDSLGPWYLEDRGVTADSLVAASKICHGEGVDNAVM